MTKDTRTACCVSKGDTRAGSHTKRALQENAPGGRATGRQGQDRKEDGPPCELPRSGFGNLNFMFQ